MVLESNGYGVGELRLWCHLWYVKRYVCHDVFRRPILKKFSRGVSGSGFFSLQ
jgi:hypothetical protein